MKLKSKQYFLLSSHREENIEDNSRYKNIHKIISYLSSKYKIPIIKISTHPRLRKKLKNKSNKKIVFHKPFSFTDYVKLQKEAKLVISDSGTINEESSILKFNAINLREAHERPESKGDLCNYNVWYKFKNFVNAIRYFEKQKNKLDNKFIKSYSKKNVSSAIIKLIISYINFIKQNNYKQNII